VRALADAGCGGGLTDINGDRAAHLAARRLVFDPPRYVRTLVALREAGEDLEAEAAGGDTVEGILRQAGAGAAWDDVLRRVEARAGQPGGSPGP